MSGRTIVPLADGRRVTGYRKTLATRARMPLHLRPDWILSFDLPSHVAGFLLAGQWPSAFGTKIGPGSHVEIRGKNKEWLLSQAYTFLRQVAPDGLIRPLDLQFSKADAPPAPYTRARKFQIEWTSRGATMIHGGVMRPITE